MKYERTKVDYRKIYEDYYDEKIPEGYHIHHIDGNCHNNDPLNLAAVTPEEHYDIHFERGDLGACALLSDGIDREAPTKSVVAYSLDGHRVGRFNSISDASKWVINNFDFNPSQFPGAIVDCCKYNSKSRVGHQWFYESEVGDIDYIGPVERKMKMGGKNTKSVPVIDLTTISVYKSKRKAGLDTGVGKRPSGAIFSKDPEFIDRFLEITKEEYNIFKEL